MTLRIKPRALCLLSKHSTEPYVFLHPHKPTLSFETGCSWTNGRLPSSCWDYMCVPLCLATLFKLFLLGLKRTHKLKPHSNKQKILVSLPQWQHLEMQFELRITTLLSLENILYFNLSWVGVICRTSTFFSELSVRVHTYNPSIWAGESQVWVQLWLHREILLKKKKKPCLSLPQNYILSFHLLLSPQSWHIFITQNATTGAWMISYPQTYLYISDREQWFLVPIYNC